ncbi:MAG: DUF7010 family protein [Novosphingobium sp.]
MAVEQAQAAMRQAFVNGGSGAIVSSLVWFAAVTALMRTDHAAAFAVLFLGGILIFPVASLIEKFVFPLAAIAVGTRYLPFKTA